MSRKFPLYTSQKHHDLKLQINCLFSLIRLTTNKASKLCITDPLCGSPSVTSGFSLQRATNVEVINPCHDIGAAYLDAIYRIIDIFA